VAAWLLVSESNNHGCLGHCSSPSLHILDMSSETQVRHDGGGQSGHAMGLRAMDTEGGQDHRKG
jgi:hypothetical protein